MSSASNLHARLAAAFLTLACVAAGPAEAGEGPRRRSTDRPAAPSAAWAMGSAAADHCSRARRKLWQPGEGWMVRTVTTCR